MSGLVGPLIVCRKGTLDTKRRRKDVDKEFALLFMVFDENESHYLDENIKLYLKVEEFDKYSEDFMESNKMHGKCVCVRTWYNTWYIQIAFFELKTLSLPQVLMERCMLTSMG